MALVRLLFLLDKRYLADYRNMNVPPKYPSNFPFMCRTFRGIAYHGIKTGYSFWPPRIIPNDPLARYMLTDYYEDKVYTFFYKKNKNTWTIDELSI
jgi:hypothetical protein